MEVRHFKNTAVNAAGKPVSIKFRESGHDLTNKVDVKTGLRLAAPLTVVKPGAMFALDADDAAAIVASEIGANNAVECDAAGNVLDLDAETDEDTDETPAPVAAPKATKTPANVPGAGSDAVAAALDVK